jgi:autoinducer 2-degrading protein
MYHVCVTCRIKPGLGDAFVEVVRRNHEGSLREPRCIRWDVLRQATPPADGEPETFFLYEVYHDEAAFLAHQQTAHYHRFRDEAEALQEAPRQGVRYVTLFPETYH